MKFNKLVFVFVSLILFFALKAKAIDLPVSQDKPLEYENEINQPIRFSINSKNANLKIHEVANLPKLKIQAKLTGSRMLQIKFDLLPANQIAIDFPTLNATEALQVDLMVPQKQVELLDVKSSSGRIDAEELDGIVHLQSESGNINVTQVRGDNISVTSESGNIMVTSSTALITNISSFNGQVKAQDLATDLRVSSIHGSTIIEKVSGAIKLKGSSRNARIIQNDGPIIVNVARGAVEARNNKGRIFVESHNANVLLKGQIEGPVRVRTSTGNYDIDNPAVSDQSISSGTGKPMDLECKSTMNVN